MPSGLFGIEHSNRTVDDHWGKNCFNSSYPTATACYMLEHNISAVYIKLDYVDGNLCVVADEIPISQVFNSADKRPNELFFSFESVFEPYQQYSFDTIDGIDLVIKNLTYWYFTCYGRNDSGVDGVW